MPRRRRIIAATGLALGVAGPAAAVEYCVTCEGPPALYRCVIAGTPDGPGKNPSSSLQCISKLAERGGHEKCAVSRGAPFPCPGLTASITQDPGTPTEPPNGAAEQDRAATHVESPNPTTSSDAPAAAPESSKPARVPRTVEELVNETVKSSKAGIEKAGEAIGGTAKKAGEQIGNAGSAIGNAASQTWTCISSFFTSCGGNDEPPAASEQKPHEPPEH